MKQQINLYQPEFRPQQRLFPAQFAFLATGLMLLAMLAIYGFATQRVGGVQKELELAAVLESAALERLQNLRPLILSVTGEMSWSERLDDTMQTIRKKQAVLNLVKGTQLGDPRGFSRHLRALAEQEIDGLWLTQISLSALGDNTRLEGLALRPELVPLYVQRLTKKSPFAEQGFQRFQIESPEATDAGPVAFSMDSQVLLNTTAELSR